jgi:chromosome partitioning protein
LTIVDTAGGWSDACTAAMAAADLCLIPTRPSPADVDATDRCLPPYAKAASRSPSCSIKSKPVTPAFPVQQALAKRAVELKMAHVLALPAIVLRNDQQDAVGIGLGVTEHAPRGKSAEEIRELWRWICTRLGLQPVTEAPAQTHAPMPIAATPEDVTAALPAPG